FEARVLAGSDDQPGLESPACYLKGCVAHRVSPGQPPPTKVTISTWSPSESMCSACRARRITCALISTATRSDRSPRDSNKARTGAPWETSRDSPFTITLTVFSSSEYSPHLLAVNAH